MEVKEQNLSEKLRENSPEEENMNIGQEIINKITHYSTFSPDKLTRRLKILQKELDIEKAFEVNASFIALAAFLLGRFGSKRWYLLSGFATGFMLQYRGHSPSFTLLRAFGIRTRREIDEEIFALRALRGDFNELSATTSPEAIIKSFREF